MSTMTTNEVLAAAMLAGFRNTAVTPSTQPTPNAITLHRTPREHLTIRTASYNPNTPVEIIYSQVLSGPEDLIEILTP